MGVAGEALSAKEIKYLRRMRFVLVSLKGNTDGVMQRRLWGFPSPIGVM